MGLSCGLSRLLCVAVCVAAFACNATGFAVLGTRDDPSGDTGGDTSTGNSGTGGSGTGGDTNVITTPPPKRTTALTTTPLAVMGRIAYDPNALTESLTLSWGGTAVGVRFFGSSLSAVLQDHQLMGQPDYLDVYLDGNLLRSLQVTTTRATYLLADQLPTGNHTVWIKKRNDASVGWVELFAFTLQSDGKYLAPPPTPTRHIETLGASVETGFGVLAQVTKPNTCHGTSALQNQDLAWPQVAADLLGAENDNLSYTGKGVLKNYFTSDPVAGPELYARIDPYDATVRWDPSRYTADAVLISLGGNDYVAYNNAPPVQTFNNAFVALIRQILTFYPQAHVYVVMSAIHVDPVRASLRTQYNTIVNTLNGEGHSRVHYLELPQYLGNTFGCDSHPDIALHVSLGHIVATTLAQDLNW